MQYLLLVQKQCPKQKNKINNGKKSFIVGQRFKMQFSLNHKHAKQ